MSAHEQQELWRCHRIHSSRTNQLQINRMRTYRNWDPSGDHSPACANPMTHYSNITQNRKQSYVTRNI